MYRCKYSIYSLHFSFSVWPHSDLDPSTIVSFSVKNKNLIRHDTLMGYCEIAAGSLTQGVSEKPLNK